MGERVAFWVCAAVIVGGALVTITRRNTISAVMALVMTFFGLAALYALLSAHFLAAIQVLVYAGAIMTLFVFVVMVLNREEQEPWALRGVGTKAIGLGAAVWLVAKLVLLVGDEPLLRYPLPSGLKPDRVAARVDPARGVVTLYDATAPLKAYRIADPVGPPPLGVRLGPLDEAEVSPLLTPRTRVMTGPLPAAEDQNGDGLADALVARNTPQPGWGGVADVGEILFTRYLFPFEAISLLLLVAVIGAIVVARSPRHPIPGGRDPHPSPDPEPHP